MTANNARELWSGVSEMLAKEINIASYNAWVANARPVMVQDEALVVEVDNRIARQMLSTMYDDFITSALARLSGQALRARYLSADEVQALLEASSQRENAQAEMVRASKLQPKYTFDTFVVGSSNRFALAASHAVAENPARAYNPLFIYGGVGLGKTHLMHAIGHLIQQQNASAKVLYITSEDFTNEFISTISTVRNNDLRDRFRERYRSVDVLLVDDIQFIAGKTQTEEEFFHTFNALHQADKQIVVTSDKQPREIPLLGERLRSRFEWGLICDIQRPDLETRIAILRKKAEQESTHVPADVFNYIAQQVDSNIRELEGSLTRVCAYASLISRPITLELAIEALHDMLARKDLRRLTPETILLTIAEFFSLRVEELTGKRRDREVTLPRQIGMYLSREMTDQPLIAIGAAFGGRDHSTVLHAYDKIVGDMKTDPRVRLYVDDIKKKLTT